MRLALPLTVIAAALALAPAALAESPAAKAEITARRLQPDVYNISYKAPQLTEQQAQAELLARSASLTRQAGYEWFTVRYTPLRTSMTTPRRSFQPRFPLSSASRLNSEWREPKTGLIDIDREIVRQAPEHLAPAGELTAREGKSVLAVNAVVRMGKGPAPQGAVRAADIAAQP